MRRGFAWMTIQDSSLPAVSSGRIKRCTVKINDSMRKTWLGRHHEAPSFRCRRLSWILAGSPVRPRARAPSTQQGVTE